MSLETPNLEQSPQQPRDNQFRFLLNVLSEHWLKLILGVVIGACSLGGWAVFQREEIVPRYRTHVDVAVIPSQWDSVLLQGMSGIPLSVTPGDVVSRTSMREVADEVAKAMIENDIAEGGPLSAVATAEERKRVSDGILAKLKMEPLRDSRKIRILVEDCMHRQEAEEIAELTARVFVDLNRNFDMQELRETYNFVTEELEKVQKSLFEAETAEWEYRRKMGFKSYGKVNEEMGAMHEELNELEVTREEIEAKLDELDAELTMNTDQLPESLDLVTEASVDGLFADLDALLQEKLTMSTVYQPAFPAMQELEERIAEKQRAIMNALAQLDDGVAGGSSVWRQRQDIYRQQVDLRMELTSIDVRAGSIKRMLEELIPRIPELANKNLEYEQLNMETERIRKEFRKLHEQELKLRTSLRRGTGKVERYDQVMAASLMPMPSQRGGVLINFLIGGIIGFVIAFGFAMLIEVNDTSIRSIEDVSEHVGLEVIGTIPRMRFGKPRGGRRRRATYVTTVDEEQIDACIVTQHDPKSPISEAYRTLRTNFQFATIKEQPRSLMVTSAVPGEGKTTTAVNLAVTMADRGIRVLIVDTDLRRPNVHRVLRMERGPGLADVLREGLDVHDVIRSTRIENLWIISSGRVPPNPSELIGSERMAQLMAQLGKEFDLIICDAPSVLVVTDPVLLATHVDTCTMVVSTNNVRRETVIRAKKLLQTANVDVAGVIVNGLDTTRRHYYYYYYYYDDGAPVRKKWYHFY